MGCQTKRMEDIRQQQEDIARERQMKREAQQAEKERHAREAAALRARRLRELAKMIADAEDDATCVKDLVDAVQEGQKDQSLARELTQMYLDTTSVEDHVAAAKEKVNACAAF